MKIIICKNCNKKFKYNGKQKNKCFCSSKCKALYGYYNTRDKRIRYQKEWDKNNKDKKTIIDKKRWESRKIKNRLEHFSRNHYFDILLDIYGGCQLCKSNDNLHIHHKKYTKDIQDCMLVCRKCHKKIHLKYNQDLKPGNKVEEQHDK